MNITTELLLNILLGAVTLNAIVGARYDIDKKKLKVATYGAGYILTNMFTGVIVMILWVWLGIETGYWQFAALPVPVFLITIGAIVSRPKEKKEEL